MHYALYVNVAIVSNFVTNKERLFILFLESICYIEGNGFATIYWTSRWSQSDVSKFKKWRPKVSHQFTWYDESILDIIVK